MAPSLYHDTDQAGPSAPLLPTVQTWEPDTVIPTSPVSLSPVLVVRTPRSSQDNRPAPVRRLGRLAGLAIYGLLVFTRVMRPSREGRILIGLILTILTTTTSLASPLLSRLRLQLLKPLFADAKFPFDPKSGEG